MCLLFFTINNDTVNEDEYKLILVNVRDEFYTRPTAPADFWIHDPDVIGGMDKQEGRSGGTWLAMNKSNGKIGILLNILQPTQDIDMSKLGRGFIVTDFINSNLSPTNYCCQLRKVSSDYNGFLTVSLELSNGSVRGSYYSNFFESINCDLKYQFNGHSKNGPGMTEEESDNDQDTNENSSNVSIQGENDGVTPGVQSGPKVVKSNRIYAFGNSMNPFQPWPKVIYGRKRFESILSRHLINGKTLISDKDSLINDLFQMLTDSTKLPIDGSMVKQGNGRRDGFIEALSTLNVHIPTVKYGSRTWTLILINGKGGVDFIERTLTEPIDVTDVNMKSKWSQSNHSFII